jgi:hypothetical protein
MVAMHSLIRGAYACAQFALLPCTAILALLAGCAHASHPRQDLKPFGPFWVTDYTYRLDHDALIDWHQQGQLGDLSRVALLGRWWAEDFSPPVGASFVNDTPKIDVDRRSRSNKELLDRFDEVFKRGLHSGRWVRYEDIGLRYRTGQWIGAIGNVSFNVGTGEDGSLDLIRADVMLLCLYSDVRPDGQLIDKCSEKALDLIAIPSARNGEWVWVFEVEDSEAIVQLIREVVAAHDE